VIYRGRILISICILGRSLVTIIMNNWQRDCGYVQTAFLDNQEKFKALTLVRYFLLLTVIVPGLVLSHSLYAFTGDPLNIVLYIVSTSEGLNLVITVSHLFLGV
jgi:hypothetical protein